jgi:hypothetical protein
MISCFVIMPFSSGFNDVYDVIQTSSSAAVSDETIKCKRLDEVNSAGRISDDLLKELHDCNICIADVSGNNPNVMWEVGFAMALNKPVILITQDIEKIPFDIKDLRCIHYDRQSLALTLKSKLIKAISETLGKFEIKRNSITINLPDSIPKTIAVTGSMDGDYTKCARRIAELLNPYLSEKITWLCGSFGMTDECAIRFLLEKKQSLFVIGYHSFDISDNILALMKQYKIPFIDAQKEQLPKGIKSPSDRDLLFLIKSDLFVVFWNGKSTGSRNLINWYSSQNKDHIVAFF